MKNFASLAENVDEKKSENTDKITEVGKSDFKKSGNRTLIILTIIRLI